ncbi:MAG: TlpA disulfide reductase family protein [Candidatus Velthaea sp.]
MRSASGKVGAVILTILLSACYSGGGPKRTVAGTGGPGALAGAPAVSYDVKRLDGRLDSLARYRGSVVVMNLWATWCPPCREEMPDLQRFYNEFKGKGVVVLGVDQGESSATAGTYARKRGVTFPILVDEDQQYGRTYEAVGLPTTVVVDRRGRVVRGIDGQLTLAQMREIVAPALKAQ